MTKTCNSLNTVDAFFALLKAGLWETDVQLADYEPVDFAAIQSLAEEQAVVGLIAAGLEHVVDKKPAKRDVLQFIGQALQLEQQNTAMNYFIGVLVEKIRKEGIYTLLVKGQAVALCYERPLWRSSGDVDFYLSEDNFKKAKAFFRPLVESFDPDNEQTRHINMHYDPWVVEIHANQHTGISFRIDKVLDAIHHNLFYEGNVRSVELGDTQVFVPSAENDILIVFTHYLKHFYKGGLGLRQICDWCRLLWTHKDTVDIGLLEKRLREMRLISEWKAFGAYAVDYLGLTNDVMPLYDNSKKWSRKANKIHSFILEVGNFGHNRDMSYYGKYPFVIRKTMSFSRRLADICRHISIFPIDSFRFLIGITFNGIFHVMHGE